MTIKKLLYGVVMSAALVGCEDDYTDWSAPQHNGQGAIDEEYVLPTRQERSDVKFEQVTDDSLLLFTPNQADAKEYVVMLSGEEAKCETQIPASLEGKVATADLQEAIEKMYGRAPYERTITARVMTIVNVKVGGQEIASKVFSAPMTLTATLIKPDISENYYVVGGTLDWAGSAASKEQKFSHSDINVYDDPVFTITIEANATGDTWFAIGDDKACDAIGNGDWSQLFGTTGGNGCTDLEGTLKRRSELGNDGSICIPNGPKKLRIELNMMEGSYKITPIYFEEYIYLIGNNTNWAEAFALQGPAKDGLYYGAMYLKSGFKFRSNRGDWNGSGNWGSDANKTEGVLINDGGSGDIPLAADGFYAIKVDIVNLTYAVTPFTQLGIIGDGQPGGWDTDTKLTYVEAERCWKATGVQLEAGKSIKFRTVGDWETVNIGGSSVDNLVFKSNDNIPVTESGTFTVKLFLETGDAPHATLTKE